MDTFAAVILGVIVLVLLAVLMLIVHAQFCRQPNEEGTEVDLGSMKPTRSELYQPSFSSVRLTID